MIFILQIVTLLIGSQFSADLNSVGDVTVASSVSVEGASALWCAVANRHEEIAKELVKAGANINFP